MLEYLNTKELKKKFARTIFMTDLIFDNIEPDL